MLSCSLLTCDRTWPTKYVVYSDFATAAECSASATQVSLPEATDLSNFIYPVINGSALPGELVQYLETLPEFDNAELINCSSLQRPGALSRRQLGHLPFPLGPRNAPLALWERRGSNSTTKPQQNAPSPDVAGPVVQSPSSRPASVSATSTTSRETTSAILSGSTTDSSTSSALTHPAKVSSSSSATASSTSPTPSTPSSSTSTSASSTFTDGMVGSGLPRPIGHSSPARPSSPSASILTAQSNSFTTSHRIPQGSQDLHSHHRSIHPTGWNHTLASGQGNSNFSTGRTSRTSSQSDAQFGGGSGRTHTNTRGPGKTPESVPAHASPPAELTRTTQAPPEQLSTSFPTLLGSPAPEKSTPKAVDKTSVAVLTQVTQDASTTVRQSRALGSPQVPTSHVQPGGIGPVPAQSMTQSTNAGAAAGGGIASLFSDKPTSSHAPVQGQPNDGDTGDNTSDGDSAPDNSVPEIVTPFSSPSGNGPDSGSTDGSSGGETQPESSSNNDGPSGSDSGSNSDSHGSGGGNTNDDPNTPASGDHSQGNTGSQNSGSPGDSGAGNQGLQSAIQSFIQKPPQSAANEAAPKQSVTIGNTPLAVNAIPTSGASSGGNDGNPESASSGDSGQDASPNSIGGSIGDSPSPAADGPADHQPDAPSDGGVVIGEQTIQPGQTGTVNGIIVSVPPSGSALVVGRTSTIDVHASTQTANIGNEPVNLLPAPSSASGSAAGVIIGGQTIQPGHTGDVNGVSVSVPTSGSALIVDGTSTLEVQSPAQTANIGGQPIAIQPAPAPTAASGGGIVLGGQTIRPGQIATINHTPVSLGPQGSSLVIGGTQTVRIQDPTQPPTLEFGGSTITANPTGAFVIGTQTLIPGSSAIVVSGSTVSLASSGNVVVINGKTSFLQGSSPEPTAAPVLTLNGQTITASISGSSTQFILGPGKTLTPGGSLVISGTTISLPSAGGNSAGDSSNIIVINGHTSTLGSSPVFPAVTTAPVLTLPNGQGVTAHVSGTETSFVINNFETLTPGGVVTISSGSSGSKTTISFPATGSFAGAVVVVNGHTSTLDTAFVKPAPVLTLSNHPITATVDGNGDAEFVFNDGAGHSQTLTRGGTITVSGSTVVFPSTGAGSLVIINGHTSTLGHASEGGALITAAPALTIGEKTYNPSITGSSTYYVIGGKTLTPGGIITVSGTRISLAEHESVLVVGSKTTTLAGPATVRATTTDGISRSTSSASSRPSSSTGSPQATSKDDSGADKTAAALLLTLASILLTTLATL